MRIPAAAEAPCARSVLVAAEEGGEAAAAAPRIAGRRGLDAGRRGRWWWRERRGRWRRWRTHAAADLDSGCAPGGIGDVDHTVVGDAAAERGLAHLDPEGAGAAAADADRAGAVVDDPVGDHRAAGDADSAWRTAARVDVAAVRERAVDGRAVDRDGRGCRRAGWADRARRAVADVAVHGGAVEIPAIERRVVGEEGETAGYRTAGPGIAPHPRNQREGRGRRQDRASLRA